MVAIISGIPGPALFGITITGSVRSSGLDQGLRGLDGDSPLGVGGDLMAQGVAAPAWRNVVPPLACAGLRQEAGPSRLGPAKKQVAQHCARSTHDQCAAGKVDRDMTQVPEHNVPFA